VCVTIIIVIINSNLMGIFMQKGRLNGLTNLHQKVPINSVAPTALTAAAL